MHVALRDGSTLLVRPIVAADAAWLGSLHQLVTADRDAAFFRLLPSSAAHVGRVVAASPAEAAALVGELAGAPCGVATYRRRPDATGQADVAIAVADAVRGRGIATRLLEALAALARRHGIRTFLADLGRGGDAMLRVLADSGFDVERHRRAGALSVEMSLEPTAAHDEQVAIRAQVSATASLRAFFEPAAVAVVGASRSPDKIGSAILGNLRRHGYTGRLVAVHPTLEAIDDVPVFPALSAVPHPVDLAIVCVPSAHVRAVVDDAATAGVKALVIITAGFSEIGEAGAALEDEIVATARRAGIRLVGPNCMGLLNTDPAVRLDATFSPVHPPAGRLAMSTQSGALGMAILDYAKAQDIGLSTFVSIGNKADVSANDLLQYWAGDDRTRVVLLYVESFGNPRKFSQIARRVARTKPIVAVKSGRSASGARAAASHTGALASSDAIVDALFGQAGVIRARTIEEMFDVARLLAEQPVPRGRRVGILTNAGGPGILAADACEAEGLLVPRLSEASRSALRAFLPREASVSNPVDMIASAGADQYERAMRLMLSDDQVDALLVIFIPPLVTRAEDVARAVVTARDAARDKPVLAIFMSTGAAQPLLRPVPAFRFPEAAAVALARAATYGDWLRRPESVPPEFADIDVPAARTIVDRALADGGGWLGPTEAAALVSSAGIAVARGHLAHSEDAAVLAARDLGFPVVLKAVGPDILHKSDLGGVVVGLRSEDAVRQAWRDLRERLGEHMTDAFVQDMIRGGVEMLVGAVEDATFGPVIACATGGTTTELVGDSQFRLHPLGRQDAVEMVAALRGARLLDGYRGREPADRPAFVDALLRLSTLIGVCPEVVEIEINPLVVLPNGVSAVDVRVRVAPSRPKPPSRRVEY